MADSWRSDLALGRAIWFHIHTDRSHGTSSARAYLELARTLDVTRVVFLEHVRRQPTYDPLAFADDVARASADVGVAASIGYEAKILPGGRLDIDDGLIERADVVGIAEHAYPGSPGSLAVDFADVITSLTTTLPGDRFVWVHPGSWLARSGATGTEAAFASMLEAALAMPGLRIERNLKYDLVSAERYDDLPADRRIVGLDAHSIDEARARWAMATGVGEGS
jgi:histidinol phosphatase-like PHP family hydrolase